MPAELLLQEFVLDDILPDYHALRIVDEIEAVTLGDEARRSVAGKLVAMLDRPPPPKLVIHARNPVRELNAPHRHIIVVAMDNVGIFQPSARPSSAA